MMVVPIHERTTVTQPTVTDPYCERNADEIPSVQREAIRRDVHPNDLAATFPNFNPRTHQFACDACWEKLGTPHPWRAGNPVPKAN